MNKYLEEGLIKSEHIFYTLIINRWSVSFTKPMMDYEILARFQHYLTGCAALLADLDVYCSQMPYRLIFVLGTAHLWFMWNPW